MQKSESIGKLAEALSKAQASMEGAAKDKNNPFFKHKYADLSSVWQACKDELTKNGLSVVQTNDVPENGEGVIIETTLLHISGEWIAGRLLMKPTKTDPQGVGSAITYGRRYALAAMVGVCPEDDDAEGTVDRKKKSTAETPKKEDAEKTVNFKFLKVMREEKDRIDDDEVYYSILGGLGYEKANQIIEPNDQKKAYAALKDVKISTLKESDNV